MRKKTKFLLTRTRYTQYIKKKFIKTDTCAEIF